MKIFDEEEKEISHEEATATLRLMERGVEMPKLFRRGVKHFNGATLHCGTDALIPMDTRPTDVESLDYSSASWSSDGTWHMQRIRRVSALGMRGHISQSLAGWPVLLEYAHASQRLGKPGSFLTYPMAWRDGKEMRVIARYKDEPTRYLSDSEIVDHHERAVAGQEDHRPIVAIGAFVLALRPQGPRHLAPSDLRYGGQVSPSVLYDAIVLMGAAFSSRYYWSATVSMSGRGGMSVRFMATPAGIRDLLSMRDVAPGKRRAALLHWVRGHKRKSSKDDDVWVRQHVRGRTTFEWDGLHGVVVPSASDMEEIERLKAA